MLAGDDAKALAAKSWFGYGRWDAPFWFIGMEPGGNDEHASYEAWLALGGTELIDCRAHHLWKRDALGIEDPLWTRWHDDGPGRRTQPTWRRLIQTLLGYKGLATDLDAVYKYQKYQLGALGGETAVVELGALHAPGLASDVDRSTFRDDRIRVLRARLDQYRPVFALCYGYGFSAQFERIAGRFDAEGFVWHGATLCVLAPGPTSRFPSPAARPQWWVDIGRRMRVMIDARGTLG